jgi:protein-disulfide isomerase
VSSPAEASAPPAAGGASSSIPQSPPRRGRWWVRVAFLLLAAALLAGIAQLATQEPDRDLIRISGTGDAQRIFGGLAQDGERLGASDADLLITFFNDVQCSTCASYFLRTTPVLVDDLARSGEAKLIYRSYSFSSAEQELGFFGAAAAGEQGYLWQYVYLFFRNQDEARREGVTDRFLQTIAGAIGGLDVAQWRDDLDQGLEPDSAMRARLERDGLLAGQLDVRARPAALVVGPRGSELLQESPSLTEIEAALDSVR